MSEIMRHNIEFVDTSGAIALYIDSHGRSFGQNHSLIHRKILTHINPTSCWYVLDLHHVNPTDFSAHLRRILLPKASKCSLIYKGNAPCASILHRGLHSISANTYIRCKYRRGEAISDETFHRPRNGNTPGKITRRACRDGTPASDFAGFER